MNKRINIVGLVGIVTLVAVFSRPAKSEGVELKTEASKTLYAIGFSLSQKVGVFNFTSEELDFVKAGLEDG
ncbi:MAG: FKBP-type peptidyl-prolyl cis-trans isomerase, partial [Nitrospirae bacterium]|nr:FKBP-type peptidyl-prolyl cis-trans isomerase [Candidatus Troglogloeales bacterium]